MAGCVGGVLGVCQSIVRGLTNFQLFFGLPITHLNHLNEEQTVLKNIKS